MLAINPNLLVISKEDLDGHPRVVHDLEARLDPVKSLHFILTQIPAIKLEIAVNSLWSDTFGNDTGFSL